MGKGESESDSGLRRRTGIFASVRRLRRDRRGATMIEFSLIMMPFFILLFGILEVGLMTWAGLELDNATSDAARLVRTGQAQAGNYDAAMLKQAVCARVSLLFDCNAKLKLDLRSFGNFTGLAAPAAFDGGGQLKNDFSFNLGGPDDIVLMTAFYEWPLINFISTMSLQNMADGNRLLRSAAVFRNEPFPGN